MAERTYSDSELRAILDKAISLQAGQQRGYNKQQIEQIGVELGLSSDLIERAVREVDTPRSSAPIAAPSRGFSLMGSRAQKSHALRFSKQLDDEAAGSLIDNFCVVTGAKGKLKKLGKHWRWTSSRGSNAALGRSYSITIRNTPAGSEVEIRRSQIGLAGGLFGGIVGGVTGGAGIGGGVTMGFLFGPLIGMGVFLTSLLFSYGLAFTIYNGVSKGRDSRDEEAIRQLSLSME